MERQPGVTPMNYPEPRKLSEEAQGRLSTASQSSLRPVPSVTRDTEHRGAEAALEVLAHEIRGALATMLVTLDLLDSSELWQSGDAPRLLERARRSAIWIAELVENPCWAVDLVGPNDLHYAPMSMRDAVESCLRIMEPLFTEREQVVRLSCDESDPIVYADSTRIAQVLVNLLRNASTYGPNSETIMVRISDQGPSVRVAVEDRGQGVPVDEQEQIFRRHTRGSTSKSSGSAGKGLGLYLAKTIVEAHGGAIGVENNPSHGATFWFTLPRLNEDDSQTINTLGRQEP
jgi:signal transduction histidine kinase